MLSILSLTQGRKRGRTWGFFLVQKEKKKKLQSPAKGSLMVLMQQRKETRRRFHSEDVLNERLVELKYESDQEVYYIDKMVTRITTK